MFESPTPHLARALTDAAKGAVVGRRAVEFIAGGGVDYPVPEAHLHRWQRRQDLSPGVVTGGGALNVADEGDEAWDFVAVVFLDRVFCSEPVLLVGRREESWRGCRDD